jgi:hypothetical protein
VIVVGLQITKGEVGGEKEGRGCRDWGGGEMRARFDVVFGGDTGRIWGRKGRGGCRDGGWGVL